jgi:hypothetical protein
MEMRIDMRGITEMRTEKPDYAPRVFHKRTTEEWYRLSCDIAVAFGAKLRHESHGGVRAEFTEDRRNPSMVIFDTGFWYDHRDGLRGGTLDLTAHLESRGFTQNGTAPRLDDASFRRLWRGESYGLQNKPQRDYEKDWSIKLVWAPGDFQDSVLEYLHSRGLRTDWCNSDIIRARSLLTNSEVEKKAQESGADFCFAVPYYDFAKFLPSRDPGSWEHISGMQRTFLAHGIDDYHPARKIGRAMTGPAGMTRIEVPAPTVIEDTLSPALLALLMLAPNPKKRRFYSEGLETGLSVAQIAGGRLHCLWSTSGIKNLAEKLMETEGALIPDSNGDDVHILLVDKDKKRDGENAMRKLYEVFRILGRRVLFLLPQTPDGVEEEWFGDWNDILLEGRMDSSLPWAIEHSLENAQDAPIVPFSDGIEDIEKIERPQIFKDVQVARNHMQSRGYLEQHRPKEALLRAHIDTTGLGKTTFLAKDYQMPAWVKATSIVTPQRRDAKRIVEQNKKVGGELFPRNSRTNVMAAEGDSQAILEYALRDMPHLLWTNDSNYRVSHSDFVSALEYFKLPACYRNALSMLTVTEKGIASYSKGETHPEQLAVQRQGVRPECTRCPHGKVADIYYRAEQKPREADEILQELDQTERYRGPFFEGNTETQVVEAPLRFFAPCASELNRRFSYREKAVCTTTQCLDKDKRLLAQTDNIQHDEEPPLIESITLNWKNVSEHIIATRKWSQKAQKKLESKHTKESEKKRIEKELEMAKCTYEIMAFLSDNFLRANPKYTPEELEKLLESIEVQQEIVQPFLQAVLPSVEHQAPFEAPYFEENADADACRYIPPVLARSLAESLKYRSYAFTNGENGAQMICDYPTEYGALIQASKPQKSLTVYSATPSKVIYERFALDKNYVDDHVHLSWIPFTHRKSFSRKDVRSNLQAAWEELWYFWERGIKTAFLTYKKQAQALRKMAKKHKPEWEDLIGWIGKHHIAHNDWSDCEGLLIWSLDLPGIDVFVREYEALRRIYGMDWKPADLYKNHWETSALAPVDFPHLGKSVECRVFDNPDLNDFIRWRVSQIITQAIGRLRGVNGGTKFCRVYTEIAPIDGLFGTYIDEVSATLRRNNEFQHQMHVQKIADAIARTLVLPKNDPVADQQELFQREVLEKRLTVRQIQDLAQTHQIGFQARHLREILDAVVEHLPQVQGYDISRQGTRLYLHNTPPIDTADIGLGLGQGPQDRLWALLAQIPALLAPGSCITLRPQDLLHAVQLDSSSYRAHQSAIRHIGQPLIQETLERFCTGTDLTFGYAAFDEEARWWIARAAVADAQAPSPAATTDPAPDSDEKGECRQEDARVLTSLNTKGGTQHTTHPNPKPLPAWIRALLPDGDTQPLMDYAPTEDLPPMDTALAVHLFTHPINERLMAYTGIAPTLERLRGDTEDRLFPTFLAVDYGIVLTRVTRDLERERPEILADGWSKAPPALADFVQHRVGLEYRRMWVEKNRRNTVDPNPLLETLGELVRRVLDYLRDEPECLDIDEALRFVEDELHRDRENDPLLHALLQDWRINPVLPRLDLTKPLIAVRVFYAKEKAA